jgi:hypothetical protein
MANRSRMETRQPREEMTLRALDAIDTNRKATEALPATNTLWRQIDRWVNEGGALGDGTGPATPVAI